MRTIQRLIVIEVPLNYRIYMALYVFQLMEARRGKMLGWEHKVLTYIHTYIEYRAVSGLFRTTPHPPLHPSVSSHRGYTLAGWRGGWGVNISEDPRHWIGLLQWKDGRVSSDEIKPRG